MFAILGKGCDPGGEVLKLAAQEGDHVNVITQFTYKTNMKFHILGLNTAKITDYIKKLLK